MDTSTREASCQGQCEGEITNEMNFGCALTWLKDGFKVARKGWNGKGMFIYLVRGTLIGKDFLRGEAAEAINFVDQKRRFENKPIKTDQEIGSHIDMKAADGSIVVGWLASQTDMLAEDYHIVE